MTATPRLPVSVAFEDAENAGSNPSANQTMGDVIAARFSRRDMLRGALAVAAISATVSPLATAAAGRARAAAPSLLQVMSRATAQRRVRERLASVDDAGDVGECDGARSTSDCNACQKVVEVQECLRAEADSRPSPAVQASARNSQASP